ncbi:MAG: DUF1735 domain-containing protein [Sphingobacteriaceae bacterium]|nr:DUF1735 domain-containing protein [Sphingobacteriaceae bacterium]
MKKIHKIIPLALLYLGLSSCLKDESYTADTSVAKNMVELAGAPDVAATAAYIYGVTGQSFPVNPTGSFNIEVKYAGTEVVAPQDITVTLVVDPTMITKYNNKIIADKRAELIAEGHDPADAEEEVAGELFDLITPNLYTLSSTTATIKKGENTAKVTVTVKPNQFDFAFRYGLPIRISTASLGTISSNFGSVIYSVGAKNEYDGEYEATGVFTHPVLGPRDIHEDKEVSTTGQYSVVTVAGDIGAPVGLVVNPTTNDVTFTGALSPTQPFIPIPGERSYYDPATKTFHLNYRYTGGGGFRVIRETLVRK